MDPEAVNPLKLKSCQQLWVILLKRQFNPLLKIELSGVLMLIRGMIHGIRRACG